MEPTLAKQNLPALPPDYRAILKQKLIERIQKNPRFSLRALARKTGISHPMLSQVLSGSKNLSRQSATKIAESLSFTINEKELFLLLVEYQSTKDPVYKSILQKTLSKLMPEDQTLHLSMEAVKIISEWYHHAILELTKVTGFQLNAKSVARVFGISELEAKNAIERLIKLGLLTKTHTGYAKAAKIIQTTHEIPNPALREHHRQMISKATAALEEQSIDRRSITGMTIAIDSSQLDAAKEKIEKLKSELSELLNESKTKDSVYQLNVQFFELTHKTKGRKK